MSLSKKKVSEMKRDLLAKVLNQKQIAKKYKCNPGTVSHIALNKIHKDVPWPTGSETDRELRAEILHLQEEKRHAEKESKSVLKQEGLFRAAVKELDRRITPFDPLPSQVQKMPKGAKLIEEGLVLVLSDMHADEVVTPEECGYLEEYNFRIACARAERLVNTIIQWTQHTMRANFRFPTLTILSIGDQTNGEIHGAESRSAFQNSFKNSLAIGALKALMVRDLAAHFEQVNLLCLSGNHGRRTDKKNYAGPQDNFDYLIAEIAKLHCRDLDNVSWAIPNAWSAQVDVNGVGIMAFHGDEIPGSGGGVPFYGLTRKQQGLVALNSMQGIKHPRLYVCGHYHRPAVLSDVDTEIIINGAWAATGAYAYNRFSGYREPAQWLFGVNEKYGVTWRLNVKLKHDAEKNGPQRYKIAGSGEVGPVE